MNRIKELFIRKPKNIVSVFFTAGYPKLNQTGAIIRELENSGADLIEVGMPFSDPLADGPTIQESSMIALANGMTIELLFEQLEDIRKEVSLPLILMGYLNPVMQFGVERFCAKCKSVGIDGLIIPDLPLLEYQERYLSVFEENGLENIFLITPQTTDERVKLIDDLTDSFIYMVSSSSTTGAKENILESQSVYFEHIKNLGLKNPVLIGFGISNYKTFSKACEFANGAIIGSAFVKALGTSTDELKHTVQKFIKSITQIK